MYPGSIRPPAGCPACTTWQVEQEKKLIGLVERCVSEKRSAPICAAGTEVWPPQPETFGVYLTFRIGVCARARTSVPWKRTSESSRPEPFAPELRLGDRKQKSQTGETVGQDRWVAPLKEHCPWTPAAAKNRPAARPESRRTVRGVIDPQFRSFARARRPDGLRGSRDARRHGA